VYESDVQKQPFLIWRKVIDYSQAKAKYGHLKPFKFVRPGVKTFYAEEEEGFYEMYDDQLSEHYV